MTSRNFAHKLSLPLWHTEMDALLASVYITSHNRIPPPLLA